MPPRTVAAAVAPLARAFAAALHMAKTTTLLVELPLLPPKPPKTPTPPAQPAPSEAPQPSATTAALPGYIDPWHVWSALTAAAEDSSRLSAALSLSNDDFADDSDRINGVGDDGGDSSTCVSDPARTERLALLRPHEWASPLYARPHPNSHSNANAHARAQSLPATTATGPVAKRARSTGNGVGVPARPVSLLASAPFISAPPEGSDGSGSDRHTLPLGRPPQPAPPLFIPPFCSVPANPASASAPGGETGTESVAATEAVSALAASAPGSGWRGHPYTLRPSAALARWLGANVRALIVPLSVFCLNGSGAWVLRRAHQAVLHLFWEHGVMVIVRDDEPDAATVPWREKRLKLDAAHAYIAALYAHRPALTPHAAFEAGYRDCLQTPLQPLADNLDAQTYEIFERDPVKYRNYTLAVERALRDWGHAQGRCPHARALTHSVGASAAAAAGTSGEGEEDEDGDGASSLDGEYSVAPITDGGAGASGARARAPAASRYCAAARCRAAATAAAAAVVMVVGAGRGPLVRCVIDAARRARVPVRVFALDKNPYAVLTLRARARGEWAAEGVDVAVVDADMRAWVPPALADVLVSELLGSFGDNELSPECLAGARHLLAPGGVSIPASSTSFLAPVYAPAVWAAVRAHDKPPLLETPFLVRLHRAWACAAPQQCFTFAHGPQPVGALRRRTRLTFEPAADAVVHGFAGYFSAELYGGVRLSIEPRTLSHGMFSWFPVFFPVARPLHISARRGEVLEVALARCGDARRVWYEWSAAVAPAAASGPVSAGVVGGSGQQTHVHNLLGRHSHIGLH
jgi:protein arginine N-methyltransferase 5